MGLLDICKQLLWKSTHHKRDILHVKQNSLLKFENQQKFDQVNKINKLELHLICQLGDIEYYIKKKPERVVIIIVKW